MTIVRGLGVPSEYSCNEVIYSTNFNVIVIRRSHDDSYQDEPEVSNVKESENNIQHFMW